MPTYIMLATWTEQGISNIKESPTRFDAFKQSLEQTGGQVKGFYLVTGQYDMVCIVEAPSDEVIVKLGLASAAKDSFALRRYVPSQRMSTASSSLRSHNGACALCLTAADNHHDCLQCGAA